MTGPMPVPTVRQALSQGGAAALDRPFPRYPLTLSGRSPRRSPPARAAPLEAVSAAVVSGCCHHRRMSPEAPADPSRRPVTDPLNPPLPTADAAYWEAAAASFDEEPDHGLRDPAVRAAWAARLRSWLPSAPGAVLDLGCGTGSLSLLAAEQGHRVTGIDRSARMIERARTKLAGRDAAFLVGDAAEPPVGERRFDAVLVRHVLWALPDPAAALRHWAGLLTPGGRLVLVEGRWGEADPIGLPADELTALVEPLAARTRVESLAHDPALWGKEVTDERYVLIADLPRRHTEVVDVHGAVRRGGEDAVAHDPSGPGRAVVLDGPGPTG